MIRAPSLQLGSKRFAARPPTLLRRQLSFLHYNLLSLVKELNLHLVQALPANKEHAGNLCSFRARGRAGVSFEEGDNLSPSSFSLRKHPRYHIATTALSSPVDRRPQQASTRTSSGSFSKRAASSSCLALFRMTSLLTNREGFELRYKMSTLYSQGA